MTQTFEFSPWLFSPPRYFFFFRFTTMLISPTIRSSLAHLGRRQMSSTAKVWIDKNTKVICQGFTGKQVGFCQQRNEALKSHFCSSIIISPAAPLITPTTLGYLSLNTSH